MTKKARILTPELRARLSAAGKKPREMFSESAQAQIRAWLAEGVLCVEIARRLGVAPNTLRLRCSKAGIELPKRGAMTADARAAGAVVLRDHFETERNFPRLFALYSEARGDSPTTSSMYQHAKKLGLKRPPFVMPRHVIMEAARLATAKRIARANERAPAVQELLDQHMTMVDIAKRLCICLKSVARMVHDGVVVRPPKPPKAPKSPRVRVAKPKAVKPPKPRKLPATWARAPAPPPKPKPVYETVEAWLAAGNRITRCPTAMLVESQATIPEADKQAMAALYAERERNRPKGANGAAMKAMSRQRGLIGGWLV